VSIIIAKHALHQRWFRFHDRKRTDSKSISVQRETYKSGNASEVLGACARFVTWRLGQGLGVYKGRGGTWRARRPITIAPCHVTRKLAQFGRHMRAHIISEAERIVVQGAAIAPAEDELLERVRLDFGMRAISLCA
jgi:hypothetical protein